LGIEYHIIKGLLPDFADALQYARFENEGVIFILDRGLAQPYTGTATERGALFWG
jgi:hypothetical protein